MTTKTRRSQPRSAPIPPAPTVPTIRPPEPPPTLLVGAASMAALVDKIAGLDAQLDAVMLATGNAERLAWAECRPTSAIRSEAEAAAEQRYGVPALRAEITRLVRLREPLLQRLALTASTDLGGLRAKLRLLAKLILPADPSPGPGSTADQLILSALADAERLAVS